MRSKFHSSPRSILLAAFAALLVFVAFPEPTLAQCAMCRTALQSPEGRALAAAFRRGILFLVVVPFSAVGIILWSVHRRLRDSEQDRAESTG